MSKSCQAAGRGPTRGRTGCEGRGRAAGCGAHRGRADLRGAAGRPGGWWASTPELPMPWHQGPEMRGPRGQPGADGTVTTEPLGGPCPPARPPAQAWCLAGQPSALWLLVQSVLPSVPGFRDFEARQRGSAEGEAGENQMQVGPLPAANTNTASRLPAPFSSLPYIPARPAPSRAAQPASLGLPDAGRAGGPRLASARRTPLRPQLGAGQPTGRPSHTRPGPVAAPCLAHPPRG